MRDKVNWSIYVAGKLLITIAFFAFALATPLVGQQTLPGLSSRDTELLNREMDLRNAERRVPSRSNSRERRFIIEKNKENFARIQILNNEIKRMTISGNAPDYGRISALAAEVKRRANELKMYLGLPQSDNSPKNQSSQQPEQLDESQFKTLVLKLDQNISNFVTNPLFRNAQVNDIHHSNRASRDLESIIELSNSLNRTSKRMRKTSSKS
ncbi:MAG: hypothetical protein WKF74_14450 [Pyrinomonadaceae bacterium]